MPNIRSPLAPASRRLLDALGGASSVGDRGAAVAGLGVVAKRGKGSCCRSTPRCGRGEGRSAKKSGPKVVVVVGVKVGDGRRAVR